MKDKQYRSGCVVCSGPEENARTKVGSSKRVKNSKTTADGY